MRIDPNTKEVTLTEIEYRELVNHKSKVDLEEEYKSYMHDLSGNAVTINMKDLARHFYKIGRTRKEE